MSRLDVLLVKENYELYTRIQNDKRKQLLSYIYVQSRKYKDLIEFSGLKPGSLYHHLSILEPLIEKRGHGLYYITESGIKIVEDLNLVDISSTKPKIKSDLGVNSSSQEINSILPTDGMTNTIEDNLSLIWLGKINYIILTIIVAVSTIMATQGVALAGSAIYATGGELAVKFDLAAFILVVLSLYVIETYKQSPPIYNRIQFIITIRLMSMLPGTVMSIGLYLLFTSDVIPSASIYPWLFVISLIFGTITTAVGVSYLRSQPFEKSLDLAILISIIDLLLGIVILMS
ncbi:MAG: hypothetical protein GPJ54_16000 [Candidatus Heimdallarchaeota archaeon]|nr:hypothetical protein [Candidatus Heimdallarchaeota archaeon]